MQDWAAWGVFWGDSWGASWGPLHEVEDEILVGGGSKPFTERIPKTADEEPVKQLPARHPWIHFPEQKQEKKPDYGIIKPEIAEIAVKAVSKAIEKRTVKDEGIDIAIAEKKMREMLKEENKRWLKAYMQVLMVEYYRQEQEYEDAQIAMMLFEM